MKGILLKQKPVQRAWTLCRSAAETPIGRQFVEGLVFAAGGFFLAGLPLLGGPTPLGAVLVLCTGFGLRGSAALLGGCGGYILLWGWGTAMEPLALALSCFAGTVIFRQAPVSRTVLAACLCLAVGGLFLLDTGFGALPLLRLALGTGFAALLPPLYDRAEAGERGARLGVGGLLLLSLAATVPPLGQTLALCGAVLLPAADRLPLPAAETGTHPGPVRALSAQKSVEKALRTMHGVLAREDSAVQPLQLAEVYDFAAEQVCRCCVRYAQCWEQNAEDTYRDLCAAGEAIVQRGAAVREDLPERFTARCCHTAGFVTAVNQSLDALLSRRREEYRRFEGRRIAAGQYLTMERLLCALSRSQPQAGLRYAPELAVGSACKTGNTVSGDRGATCKDRFGNFYVLLCDGMGTGAEARTESDRAVRLLTAFLETGMETDTALALLNGFFVLRKETVFTTVDLLRVDLRTGSGILYKWGAAPSFLRRGETVEKIGTATPPPGLDAAQSRVPGQFELSLKEGETLVMVSDGAYGEETAQRLAAFTHGTVRDLASCLITLGEADAADDRTAVVVRLRKLKTESAA